MSTPRIPGDPAMPDTQARGAHTSGTHTFGTQASGPSWSGASSSDTPSFDPSPSAAQASGSGASTALELRIDLDREDGFLPGETLRGRASWRLDRDPSTVDLRLFWYTSGKGTRDIDIVHTQRFEHPRCEEQRAFSIDLPREPYSFSGTLISLIWAIELIVAPGLEAERKEFVLSPSRNEIVLPQGVV